MEPQKFFLTINGINGAPSQNSYMVTKINGAPLKIFNDQQN